MLTAFVLLVFAPIPTDEATEKDFTALQGTWQVTEYTLYGRKERPEEFEGTICTIDKDVLTIARGTSKVMYRLDLSSGKDPKRMDWIWLGGTFKGHASPGIYRIQGDLLTICLAPPKTERPADFASEQKKGTSLLVLKRKKPPES